MKVVVYIIVVIININCNNNNGHKYINEDDIGNKKIPGKIKWKREAFLSGRLLTAIDDKGNIFANDGVKIFGIDADGEIIFETVVDGWHYGITLGKNEDLFVCGSRGNIYSINKNNGELRWKRNYYASERENYIYSEMIAVDEDGSALYYAPEGKDRSIIVQIKSNGEVGWTAETEAGSFDRSSIVIGKDGTIYVGSGDPIEAYTKEGRRLWTKDNEIVAKYADSIYYDPIIDENGDLIFISDNGRVFRLSKDGDIIGWGQMPYRNERMYDIWRCDGEDSPTAAWGYIYLGADGDGCPWRVTVGEGENLDLELTFIGTGGHGGKWGSRALVTGKVVYTAWRDFDEVGVVATDLDGNLKWVSESVKVRWDEEGPEDDTLVTPVVGPDGTIYVRESHFLIAFEGEDGVVLEGGWPKPYHDAANSNNAARGLYE